MPQLPDVQSFRRSDLASNIMFFSPDLLEGDAPNLTDLIVESLKGMFVETDKFFRFRINPQQMNVRKGKVLASTFTKIGYAYSHYGNEMTRLAYQGTTGYFRPPNIAEVVVEVAGIPNLKAAKDKVAELILAGQLDISRSPVWTKFRRFETFWDRIDGDMILYFDQRLYRGELVNFNYRENANDPLQIQYDFEFHAHTDTATGPDRLGKALIHLGIR